MISRRQHKAGGGVMGGGELPETLIPKEFHLVQSKAALGLEYNKEMFSVKTKDHEEHLTKFPSLKPVSRKEIIELKNVMDKMIDAVGATESNMSRANSTMTTKPTTAMDEKSPTQMHSLLTLVKQEQDIYNIIFHEIIRQTTVECKERGEILSALRQRYAGLLDKVPRHVRSMHAEVMAQRALDRRLTEELLKFKSAINSLTKELTDVREREQTIAEQSRKAKEELRTSLIDSEKNSSLLTEYHDLYELQRQRLEHQISVLSEEKEIWSTACYTMAVKITENNRLNTAKRLHMAEKTWAKLASHYSLFLADRDCELMANLQSHADKWREIISEMNYKIAAGDKSSKVKLMALKDEMTERCVTYSKTMLNAENRIVQPSAEAISRFHQDLKNWQEVILGEVKKYSGDTLLQYQEQYSQCVNEVQTWNEIAHRVFSRHQQEDGTKFPEHEKMHQVNETVNTLMAQFNTLILGENGTAKFLIQVSNEVDQWEVKMHSLVNGAQTLSESDWLKFLNSVRQWPTNVETVIGYVGKTQSFDRIGKPYEELSLEEALKSVQVWMASATNGIDNETQKIIDKVGSVHKSLIHWMVQVLLKLAPDRPDNVGDSYNANFATVEQIEEQGLKLEKTLIKFSEYLISCCGSAVMDVERGQTVDTDAEYRDLKKIAKESNEWVNTGRILVQELRGDAIVSIGDIHPTDRQDTVMSTLSNPDSIATTTNPQEPGGGRVVQLELNWLQIGKLARKKQMRALSSSNADRENTTLSLAGGALSKEQSDLNQQQAASGPNQFQGQLGVSQAAAPPVVPANEVVQAVCTDQNVRAFDLEEQRQKNVEVTTAILKEKADIGSEEDPKQAYESIAFVEQLQAQIIDTEKRAQSMEQRALEAEQKLAEVMEQLRESNINLDNVKREVEREKQKAEEEKEAEKAKKEDAEIAAERAKSAAANKRANKPMPPSTTSQSSTTSSQKGAPASHRSSAGSVKNATGGNITNRSQASSRSSSSRKK
ncbi:axonemal dynein light chain domain-containing protein 1-like isoform X2 [Convolutriloba macropyga]|uniref:axonemal dynein light chain domain-containing protein 1-like isoform X2 n=1 Tax=Convolutriloba macropyga TaxID=536237 RepID=UPI003F528788